MNPRQFYDLVVEMRAAQKLLKAHPSCELLLLSSTAEQLVDMEIERVTKILNSRK